MNNSMTEDSASREAMPEKLSQLRQKLGQKTKQEPRFNLNRRSQRQVKKPADESHYVYFKRLGVEFL